MKWPNACGRAALMSPEKDRNMTNKSAASDKADATLIQPDRFAALSTFALGWALAQTPFAHEFDPMQTRKFGIKQADFPRVLVADLDEAGATTLYRETCWDALGCEKLPDVLAATLFGLAIFTGPLVATRILGMVMAEDCEAALPKSLFASAMLLSLEDQQALSLEMLALALRRFAFTADAANQMVDWAKAVIGLDRFIQALNAGQTDQPVA